MELVARLAAASIFYLILLLMIGTATPYRVDHPVVFCESAIAIVLALLLRILLFVLRRQLYSRGREWILVPVVLSTVLSTGVTGLLHLHILKSYGLSNWTFTVMMMWILGIAAGSTVIYISNMPLQLLGLVLLFGPALPYEFLANTPHGLSHGISTLAFMVFLFVQGRRLHSMYWDLLSDRAIEIERTRELEAAKTVAERVQAQLRYQATHDILTGIMNRAEILRVFGRELERAIRLGTPLGVLMIDLDYFKQVNDRNGHLGGDEVLRAVAERIQRNLRSYDALGRYGGEEFLVLLPGCDHELCAVSAERIRLAIECQPVELLPSLVLVTASFGVTVLDSITDTEQRQLIARADTALYQAKKNGRNRIEVCLSGPLPVCSLLE